MELPKAKSILSDKNSSEEQRKLARQELVRAGYFQRLNPDLVPEKMFIKIKANPNILKNGRVLSEDLWLNLIHVGEIDFCRFSSSTSPVEMFFRGSNGIRFRSVSYDDRIEKTELYFAQSDVIERAQGNYRSRELQTLAESAEREGFAFISGTEAYEKLLKALNSHTTEI